MKNFIAFALISVGQVWFSAPTAFAGSEKVWISFDKADLPKIPLPSDALIAKTSDAKRSLVLVNTADLGNISVDMHEIFHRCGGFFQEDLAELQKNKSLQVNKTKPNIPAINPSMQDDMAALLSQVDQEQILETIKHLSSFKNRYHRSSYGASSQQWVAQKWRDLTANIPGTKVTMVSHSRTPQNSVRLAWQGSDPTLGTQIVVLGGHGDSIVGYSSDVNMRSPGADDNASGIATITEVIRILAKESFQPKRSIHFFSYAAEEVGLWGSKEIARQYYDERKNVVAVMQLDMTNYAGPSADLALITDYTNQALTKFAGSLLTTYMPEVNWTHDRCGYACSDHASWDRYGYPTAFPIESLFDESNPSIHSENDTLASSNNNATHAVPFAKLALAFTAKQSN